MPTSQRRLILIATLVLATLQLARGFQGFLQDSGGGNLLTILPLPLLTIAVGVAIWYAGGRGGPRRPEGRVMKGPWRH